MAKVQFELARKLSNQEKLEKGISGFAPVKARWVLGKLV